jgi:hypothetical protein
MEKCDPVAGERFFRGIGDHRAPALIEGLPEKMIILLITAGDGGA